MIIKLNPAKRVIDAFGGAANLAKAIHRNVSRVHRWSYPEEHGGTGGAIPGGTKMLQAILAAAKEQGIALSIEDLISADDVNHGAAQLEGSGAEVDTAPVEAAAGVDA